MPHPMIQAEAFMDKYGAVFTVTLPYPESDEMKNLNPHSQFKGGYGKAAATKSQLKMVRELCIPHMPIKPWRRCRLSYRFYKPSDRTLDHYNMTSRFKAAVDGVVQAGLIPDDKDHFLEGGAPLSDIDRDNPRVELVFERLRPQWRNEIGESA